MYDKTVTVFNLYESSIAAMWYPHVLSGVDLNANKGQLLRKYGPESTDNAELHINYIPRDGKVIISDGRTGRPILNSAGNPLIWLKPEDWSIQVNDSLKDTITFNSGDFFWLGEWKEGPVSDSDYQDRRYEGFYAYMNEIHDFVYRISSVALPFPLIPHFEILGK